MSEEKKKDKYGTFLRAYYHIFQLKFEGKKFNLTDKIMSLLIHSLDNLPRRCTAGNEYFSETLGISESAVSNSIGRLTDLKLIDRDGQGKNRVLISKLPLPQPIKINEVDGQPIKINEVDDETTSVNQRDNLGKSKDNLLKSTRQPIKINEVLYKDKINILDERKDKKDLSSDKTSEVISPESTSTHSKIIKEDKLYSSDCFPYMTSEYLLELVLKNYPNFDKTRLQNSSYREKKLQKGAHSIDLMVRIDKRPENEIIEVIEWSSKDNFWRQNIKSPDKLRIQYDQLLIKMGKMGNGDDIFGEDDIPDLKEYDNEKLEDARMLAEYYWMIQIETGSNTHLSLQQDSKKLNATLWKWTKEFYKLIVKHNPSYSEVEQVIRFVYSTKYYSKARYSAGYFCSKYVAIRELMERIEFQSLAPEFW